MYTKTILKVDKIIQCITITPLLTVSLIPRQMWTLNTLHLQTFGIVFGMKITFKINFMYEKKKE